VTAPDDGGQGEKPRKYPPGTVVIWVAVSAVGLWLLGSGLVGILSGN
jgi:hypothetical protein